MSICFGKNAAQANWRERTIPTIETAPAIISAIRLRLRSASDGGTNVSFLEIAADVLRSNMIAINTTAIPATKPSPTFRIIKASITGLPSPGAPISAAITTKESAAITV